MDEGVPRSPWESTPVLPVPQGVAMGPALTRVARGAEEAITRYEAALVATRDAYGLSWRGIGELVGSTHTRVRRTVQRQRRALSDRGVWMDARGEHTAAPEVARAITAYREGDPGHAGRMWVEVHDAHTLAAHWAPRPSAAPDVTDLIPLAMGVVVPHTAGPAPATEEGQEEAGRLPHHPHYLSHTPAPCPGAETDPQCHFETITEAEWEGLAAEDRHVLAHEQEAAYVQWEGARRRREAARLIREVEPLWGAYAQAHEVAHQAWARLRAAPDGEWRAAVLALTEAHQGLREAARRVDRASAPLARALHVPTTTVAWSLVEREVPLLGQMGERVGVDTRSWEVGHPDEYTDTRPCPADYAAGRLIQGHLDALRQVDTIRGAGQG
ncbi:hypothetical protein [Nocardiopsis sp. NPDC006938]|uniref:hypothetical protein n=1 Tax=Nocardiopsis sp. NPDC006938 TaxID=3364337 RepID=UPI0036AF3A85